MNKDVTDGRNKWAWLWWRWMGLSVLELLVLALIIAILAWLWPSYAREGKLVALTIAHTVLVLIATFCMYVVHVHQLRDSMKDGTDGKPTIATLKHRAEMFAAAGLLSFGFTQFKSACELQIALQLGACMDQKWQVFIAFAGYIFLFAFAAFAVSIKVAIAKVERERNPQPPKKDDPWLA
ncbi:hypothetical protein IP92_01521 [Pseudoduganella flava]|uniref:TRAP transporter small permease subunit n=1 Tax=Pseudoduganella flava TaxID=871742 RepID=A0A562Q0S5_9BURK|nr:magnesium transporter [Pseudoduganella flava]QGZ38183.1 hypothetical protein GO485_03380 [Pseudoduganella flava]TWI50292.1 hypothetical protein IP92_01521 [Pseudoduganella flava]